MIGILDNQSICVRHVDTGLDDGRTDEDVHLAVDHLLPDLGKLFLAHFAVRYSDGCIGERRAERSGLCVNGIDVVVQIKHLSAAPQLSPDGFADKHLVVFGDVGLHRHAVLRRFLEHRHIADARQRHIQRARNGGRRQRQAVDSDRKLLEPLLVRHTEALLLVDNHQTEIFEADILLQQAVRADDHIDFPAVQIL